MAFVIRFVGFCLIAAALAAAVVDSAKSIDASAATVTSLGQTWFTLARDSFVGARAVVADRVEVHVGRWVWDPLIQSVLALPTWLVAGGLGGLMIWLGSPRRRIVATDGTGDFWS